MKKLLIKKVKDTNNPADLGAKHLKLDYIGKHLSFLNFSFPGGRSNAAPGIAQGAPHTAGASTGAAGARRGRTQRAGPVCARHDRSQLRAYGHW